MAHTISIKDTHAAINMLVKEYQVPKKTAEGIIHILREVEVPADKETATKKDIQRVEESLKRVEEGLRSEMKPIKWAVGINAGATLAILLLLVGQSL